MHFTKKHIHVTHIREKRKIQNYKQEMLTKTKRTTDVNGYSEAE